MGEGGTRGEGLIPPPRRGAGIFFLRLLAGIVVLAVGIAFTRDLAAKSTEPPAPRPTATEAPSEDDAAGRGPRYVAREGAPTIYDAVDAVDDCAGTRRSFGPSSTAPGLADDVRRISRRVARLRGLAFERRVETRLVSRTEVGARFARGYRRQNSAREADASSRVLVTLGLLEPGTDLREQTVALVQQGVSGFYSPRREILYAGATAGVVAPFEEVVLAHELDHALVDQALGLPGTMSRDPLLSDVMLGHLALVEGDATLAMSKYGTARLTPEEIGSFLQRFGRIRYDAGDDVPYVLARSTEFPYYEGLLFVCLAWREGGWGRVDRLYALPPASSAEIVFPDRYPRFEPRLPKSPPSPRNGWEPLLDRSFGVFDLMLLLENADLVGTAETVVGGHAPAARGWAGGVLHSWARGDATAVHLALVDAGVRGEDGRRRRRLCRVLRGWYEDTFPDQGRDAVRGADVGWTGPRGAAGIRCDGASVRVAIGPGAGVVARLLR